MVARLSLQRRISLGGVFKKKDTDHHRDVDQPMAIRRGHREVSTTSVFNFSGNIQLSGVCCTRSNGRYAYSEDPGRCLSVGHKIAIYM